MADRVVRESYQERIERLGRMRLPGDARQVRGADEGALDGLPYGDPDVTPADEKVVTDILVLAAEGSGAISDH